MNCIANDYLAGILPNVEIRLVAIIAYDEKEKITLDSESHIKQQIKEIIERRFNDYDNTRIDLDKNPILSRITYIVFPIWELSKLLETFQEMIS